MFCNKCGTEIGGGAKFCANCGGSLAQIASSLNTSPSSVDASGGFLTKLSRGDYGLANTYWLYGVLVGIIINIVFSTIKSPGFIATALLVYIAYEIHVIIGIWRAATKYTGPKIWAILAKIACVFGGFMLLVVLLAIFDLMKYV